MDPLTALGLASNIVQFVDFASKLVSTTHTLYFSASGSKGDHLELEGLAQNLQQLAEKACPLAFRNEKALSKEDETLNYLSNQCREISDELLSVLGSLKVRGDHKKWKSFYQALQAVRKEGDIKALQLRLDRIGHQLGTQVLVNQQSKVLIKLDGLDAGNRRLEITRAEDIRNLRGDFKRLFEQIEKDVYEEGAKNRALVQLSLTAERGVEYSAEQRILDFIRFDTIDDRHIAIRPAHAETLCWIFETSPSINSSRSPTKFVEWLKSDDSLYWISGKPGSGKSTLMKYLCDHELSQNNLKSWAGGYQLAIASFFFWNAGRVDLQKSQEGLLRSILYQILRQSPDLIPDTFPSQWHSYVSGGLVKNEPSLNFLTVQELLAAFHRISARLSTSKIKFCFFIDGLDEYEGKSDDVIRLIEVLRSLPNVKMCVSSRPLNEFEKFFGQDQSKKLYIHDLTKNDIELYVRDTLERDPSYQELIERDDGSLDLVQDIVDAARGVFLWVFLVVRSLLEGLTNGDRIVDLQRRLRDIPTDLNKYFERILFNVDDFYRKQTAHMFQVTLAAREKLPLMSYWFIDQEDSELAMKLEIQPLSFQKTNMRLKQMRKRLNACCQCLLEVQFYDSNNAQDSSLSSSVLFNLKVDFLHRTVRDFLRVPEMQTLLEKWAGPDFNADIVICQAILAQIKTAPQDQEYFTAGGPVRILTRTFEHHAKFLNHMHLSAVQATLRTELDRTIRYHRSAIGEMDEELIPTDYYHQDYITEQASSGGVSIWGKLSGVASRVVNRLV